MSCRIRQNCSFLPHKRIASDFVIDTGSPHTILNYTDSIRLGIPHNTKSEIVRMGGRVYQSYIYDNFEMILKSLDNQEIIEKISIRVIKPISSKMKEIENLDKFPNLLGLDFLEKWDLICKIKDNEIFLEKN